MAHYTDNFNLYEKDPATDGADLFSITTMMNDNWDKIDANAQKKLTAGNNISINGQTISAVDVVPTSRTINGQPLTSNITISAIPSQTGQGGKYLTTDGSTASWGNPTANYYTKTEADSKFVDVAGDTMTGDLTITTTGTAQYKTKNTVASLGTTPTSRINSGGVYTYDKDDKQLGIIQSYIESNGRNGIQLITRKPDNSGWGTSFEFGTTLDGKQWFNKPQIITAYVSGTSGYNIWSNGYCEQWGQLTTAGYGKTSTVLTKKYANTNYQILLSWTYETTQGDHGSTAAYRASGKATDSFIIYSCFENYQPTVTWRVFGYLASGEY